MSAAVEAAAKAIFLADYLHLGEESWDTARLDGNSDRPEAFDKARAALDAALPHLAEGLAEVILAAMNSEDMPFGRENKSEHFATAITEELKRRVEA